MTTTTNQPSGEQREGMPCHPATELLPPLPKEEYEQLVADIRAHGLRVPILRYQGQILDGRHRYRACAEAGIPPRYEEWDGLGSPYDVVASLNLHRRHLPKHQRLQLARKFKELYEREARAQTPAAPTRNCDPGPDREAAARAAKAAGLCIDDVYRDRKVQREGCQELRDSVDAGAVSVSAAAEVASLSKEEQSKVVGDGPKAVRERARKLRQHRRSKPKRPGKAPSAPRAQGQPVGPDAAAAVGDGPEPPDPGEPGEGILLDLSTDERSWAERLLERAGRERAARLRDALSDLLQAD